MPSLMNTLANNVFAMKTLNYLSLQIKKRIPYADDNPFLKGPYAPVKDEIITNELKITGEIPKSLNGLLLRMGPNPVEITNPTIYNWFVGDGMVHALRLSDGQALWYKNRYVGTHKVHDFLKRPRIKGKPRGAADITNTNVIGHAGRIWTIVEAGPLPVEMDAELNSQSYSLFKSKERFEFTAHPRKDPTTGDLHAICYDALTMNKIHYHVINAEGKLTKRVSIPVKHGPMIHDCNMTQSQMIIFDLPITFSINNIIRGADFPYAWNNKHPARVGLLPKTGTAEDIQWFNIDPCYVFHSCNAYDLDNGDVILDLAVHGKTFEDTIQGPSDTQNLRFESWHFVRSTGQVNRKVVSNLPQEFPRFDERATGQYYRYAYTISVAEGADPIHPENLKPNYLYRHDLETDETQQHFYGEGYSTGEVIFIPRTPDSAEDDGWLISYVHSIDQTKLKPTKIVILDAKNIEGEPQAVIELPVHVPLGFHSNWVNQNEIETV